MDKLVGIVTAGKKIWYVNKSLVHCTEVANISGPGKESQPMFQSRKRRFGLAFQPPEA